MNIQEGDLVRVRPLAGKYWSGVWRVSSVMDRPPLAYIRQVDGSGKGYIEQRSLTIEGQAESETNSNTLNQLELF